MTRISAVILGLSLLATAVQAEDTAPGKSLEFEVSVIHLRSVDGFTAEQRALTGAALQKAVADWRAAGKVERMTTMRMSALESQPASVQIGEMAAVVVGRTFTGARGGPQPGFAVNNMQMEQYGTMVECTVIGAFWNDGAEGTTATIVLLVPRLVAASRK